MKSISFSKSAFDQFLELQKDEPSVFKKLLKLLDVVRKTPFEGIGKPEALKHNLKSHWSRRITDEHRLVYRIKEDEIIVIACKFYYSED